MQGDHRKFIILSVLIIILDVIQQVAGVIILARYYIYKTEGCTYYFYSSQCCPSTNHDNDSFDCSQAKSIQEKFIIVLVCPFIIYLIFMGCLLACQFLCSAKQYLAIQLNWYLMLISTIVCRIIFIILATQVSILTSKSDDNQIMILMDVYTVLVQVSSIKFFLLIGISCEVHSQIFWQQQNMPAVENQQPIKLQQPIVMQTVILNSIDQPFYDQITQGPIIHSQQWQRNQQCHTDGSIVNEQPEHRTTEKQLILELGQEEPIIFWPVEGQAINK